MQKNLQKKSKKYQELKDQLKDAAITNGNLLKDLEKKEENLSKFRSSDKELAELRKENNQFLSQVTTPLSFRWFYYFQFY